MSVEVRIPEDLWADDGEGVVATWLFADGERVAEGSVLAEVMYEKTSTEILAPAAGTLCIVVAAEVPVRKGQVIARVV
jgi:pyruvate/2-oxoglutarate dehydrogenase complex dihydrolipoamide acyltransferase (E2) component